MEEVEEICSRIAIVDHGKVIAEGTKEQLKAIITDTRDIWVEVKNTENLEEAALKEIKGVNSISIEENIIKINSQSEVNNLNHIIQFFISRGIEIRSLQEQAPNLETVFLTLTGRNLRD
jgi:ABC-2 type transport system ATP-binding protein